MNIQQPINTAIPPIIIWENGNIMIFDTIKKAESYLEAIDVRNNEYQGYDNEGRQLTLEAIKDRVHIRITEPIINREQELNGKLRDFLQVVRDPLWNNTATLEELITACRRYAL